MEDEGRADARGWQPIETVPHDRYVLLYAPDCPDWDGNMEVGRWFGDEDGGRFWSCGGPNGGLPLDEYCGHHGETYTHWMDLPQSPLLDVTPKQTLDSAITRAEPALPVKRIRGME